MRGQDCPSFARSYRIIEFFAPSPLNGSMSPRTLSLRKTPILKFRKCPLSWASAVGFSPSYFCCELMMFIVNLSTFSKLSFVFGTRIGAVALCYLGQGGRHSRSVSCTLYVFSRKYMISLRYSRVTVIVSIIFVMIAILLLSSPRGDTRRTDIEAEIEVFHSIPFCEDVSARVSTKILVVTGI